MAPIKGHGSYGDNIITPFDPWAIRSIYLLRDEAWLSLVCLYPKLPTARVFSFVPRFYFPSCVLSPFAGDNMINYVICDTLTLLVINLLSGFYSYIDTRSILYLQYGGHTFRPCSSSRVSLQF